MVSFTAPPMWPNLSTSLLSILTPMQDNLKFNESSHLGWLTTHAASTIFAEQRLEVELSLSFSESPRSRRLPNGRCT